MGSSSERKIAHKNVAFAHLPYMLICSMAANITTTPPTTLIYTKVFPPKRIQYNSARVQRHDHHKKHSEVKKLRILRYSFVVI